MLIFLSFIFKIYFFKVLYLIYLKAYFKTLLLLLYYAEFIVIGQISPKFDNLSIREKRAEHSLHPYTDDFFQS